MRIQMLRNLAVKPGIPEKAKRFEGQEYDVSSKEGTDLIRQGLAIDVNKPAPVVDPEEDDGDGLKDMKFADLKVLAESEGITLTGKSKASAVAEIRAARAGETGDGDGEESAEG